MAKQAARIQVTGLNELYAGLKSAPGRLDRELGKANRRAVNEAIRPPVRAGAPHRSGRLESSVRGAASAKTAALMVGDNNKVPYAGVINFGWPARNISPQEFIYSGIDEGTEKMMKIYLEHVDKGVQPIAPEGSIT